MDPHTQMGETLGEHFGGPGNSGGLGTVLGPAVQVDQRREVHLPLEDLHPCQTRSMQAVPAGDSETRWQLHSVGRRLDLGEIG